MVVQILDFIFTNIFKQWVNCLSTMFLTDGVSILGFILAVMVVLLVGGMLILR